MNSISERDLYSLEQLNRLHDDARVCAVRMHDRAITDFLHGTGVQTTFPQQRARRAAERFASSLNRRLRQRAEAPAGR